MIIKDLNICDFKNYAGENKFDFTISPNRNIILIGGFNGAGKTTLTESIRLCLYGSMMNGTPMSDAQYQKYLKEVISKTCKTGSFKIEMTVEFSDTNPHRIVTIARSFTKKGSKFEEHLALKNNDSLSELIKENYWDYYVEKIIPSTASRYFFFDGENIKNVISSDAASDYLETALKDLSGISDLLSLDNDLVELRKRIMSKSASKTSKSVISELEKYNEKISNDNVTLSEDIDKNNLKIEKMQHRKTLLEEQLKRIIGFNEDKYTKRENEINQLKKELADINNEVVDYAQYKLPFIITRNNLIKTIKLSKEENKSQIDCYIKDYLDNLQNSDVAKKFDKASLKEFVDILNEDLKINSKNNTEPILNLSLQQASRLESLLDSLDDGEEFISLVKKRETLEINIKDKESELSNREDENTTKVRTDLMHCNDDINKMLDNNKFDAAVIERNNDTIKENRIKIAAEEKKTLLSSLDSEMVSNIEIARIRIKKRIEKSRSESIKILNNEINNIYFKLRNKKSMVKEISITDKMEIVLKGYDKENVNVKIISEGEKGILMYSVIHGLHKLSKVDLPMIVDSPLGKMDSIHTGNLISKYYPFASEQVILLSHDREITPDAMTTMEDHISAKYLIRSEKQPKIVKGYFE